MRGPAKKRFDAKVIKASNGCWLWSAYKNKQGYGAFSLDGSSRVIMAHRASFVLHVGEIQDGKCVLHRCDTPSCVNPEHLFLGTREENSLDRDLKGRGAAQKPGYVPPIKGKSKYPVCLNGHGFYPVKCSVCGSDMLQSSRNYKAGMSASCSKKCKYQAIHLKRWGAA